MGVLGGLVGRWNAGRQPRWVERVSSGTRRVLAGTWLPLFSVAVVAGVFLVFGSTILVYTVDLNAPALFEGTFYALAMLLLLMVPTTPAFDGLREDGAAAGPASFAGAREITPLG